MNSTLIFIFICVIFLQFGPIQSVLRPKRQCNHPTFIYSNLQCNPRFDSGGKKPNKPCPACFDCSQINSNIKKCYYRGKYYSIGETIDDSEPVPRYYVGCVCTDQLTFSCAIVDCAFPNVPEGCYATQSFDSPCPNGYKCPNENSLVCNVNGYRVNESLIFTNPKDQCSECLCEVGVTGSPEDEHCRSNVCDVELFQCDKIQQYCAAVYSGPTDCCPYDYTCPSFDDNFIDCDNDCTAPDPVGPRVQCVDQGDCKTCRYGKYCYPIGTKFVKKEDVNWSSEKQITNCECVIPPYFSCTRIIPLILGPGPVIIDKQ